MDIAIANAIVLAAGGYLAVGVIFAVPFVLWWAGRLDRAAQAGTRGFRLLILPGAVLLWPILLRKVLRTR